MLKLPTKLLIALIPACVAFPLSVLPTQAEMPVTPLPQGISVIPTDTSSEPQLFIDEAGQFMAREKQLGELALQKSGNVSVQAYARQMIDHHTRLETDLNMIARQVHAAAPRQRMVPPEIVTRLNALQGADFDRAYVDASISNHQAAIASFQNEGMARDPRGINLKPLSDWAAGTVSSLNDELTRAQTLGEILGTSRDNTLP